ncbi:MAG: sulfatase-like hydrolase/transferase [Verrucomicrobiales bacterium]|nr:sulfatase-like hydrolase/transferase [Verrucomicrobiales bacterium]
MKLHLLILSFLCAVLHADDRPNVILVMSDDQGWGQTGYYNHPHLKTPHLDEMAAHGLRLDRFYAGASNCSPTRATVMTGRTNDRTGVQNHGFPIRLQEKTIATALRDAGYSTAHFGKWHLNGLRGPGVPVLKDDTHSPGELGFDHWLTVTNFFDRNPVLSRMGEFEEFEGDSSEIVINEALKFIGSKKAEGKPVFTVVWFGSPHSPMVAVDDDRTDFSDLKLDTQHHLGELVAMDRSIGALRKGLQDLEIAENTIVWFNSDNGGLAPYGPETMGGLRGSKNQMYEGGLRVPCVIEWPKVIAGGRISKFPAGTVDIFPTIAEVAGLDPDKVILQPYDGISLRQLFDTDIARREKPLGFRHDNRGVIIDNEYKYLSLKGKEELYHLEDDKTESKNLAEVEPEVFSRLKTIYTQWNDGVEASVAGKDYPEGIVAPNQPERRFWNTDPAYLPYIDLWKDRPEYKQWLNRSANQGKGKQKKKKKSQ